MIWATLASVLSGFVVQGVKSGQNIDAQADSYELAAREADRKEALYKQLEIGIPIAVGIILIIVFVIFKKK